MPIDSYSDLAEPQQAGFTAPMVARGVTRLFAQHAIWMMAEYSLPNKRRADLVGMDKAGHIIMVEIKVAKADLLGDQKWTEYLDYCDQFYWALSPGLDAKIVSGELFFARAHRANNRGWL